MAHSISNAGLNIIKEFEGTELTAYKDAAGLPTVGTGHLITQKDGIKVGDTITEKQATDLLRHDVARTEQAVNDAVTVDLSQHQFDALVSLVFNIGAGNFRSSTLLEKLNDGDYQGAADQFPVWRKAGGRVLSGLEKRRAVERHHFLTEDT